LLVVVGRTTGLVVVLGAAKADDVWSGATLDGSTVGGGATTAASLTDGSTVGTADGNAAPTDTLTARSRTMNAAPPRIASAAIPMRTATRAVRDRRGGGGRLDRAGMVSEFCGVTRRTALEGV